ncbi:hypothetical protein MASR2M66_11410 [Chloroflexota bacterium]|jgi:hypothetical protein
MSNTDLATITIYVIEKSRDMKKHFVWATSLQKAHAYGKNIFPGEKYSTRSPTPLEWQQVNEKFSWNGECEMEIPIAG